MCSPPQTRTCPCRAELGSADVGLVVLCDCARVSHCGLDVVDTGWSLEFRPVSKKKQARLGCQSSLINCCTCGRFREAYKTLTPAPVPRTIQHSCMGRRQSQRQPAEASACQASSIACVTLRRSSSQSPHAVRPLVAGRSPRRRRQDHGRQRHLPRRR